MLKKCISWKTAQLYFGCTQRTGLRLWKYARGKVKCNTSNYFVSLLAHFEHLKKKKTEKHFFKVEEEKTPFYLSKNDDREFACEMVRLPLLLLYF